MGNRRELNSEVAYRRALKKGYGRGAGADYLPWIRVQDVSTTKATGAKILGLKTGRTHQFISQIEKQFFYLAEFSRAVCDIREQFPLLPLDLAKKISDAIGVDYPFVPGTKVPHVMTTDFLLTISSGQAGQDSYVAVGVKPSADLQKQRTMEKLEIERVWWELHGVKYWIFTGNKNTKRMADNIKWLTNKCRHELPPSQEILSSIASWLTPGEHTVKTLVQRIEVTEKLTEKKANAALGQLALDGILNIDMESCISKSGNIRILGIGLQEARYGS